MSFHAGHARLKIGAARISVTNSIGTVSVAINGESELGKNDLSSSNVKHKRLLFSRSDSALSTPPVMLSSSRPEKELTVPVLPPMLYEVSTYASDIRW
jgi:hypothetical protein